jgi:plasmid stability protein
VTRRRPTEPRPPEPPPPAPKDDDKKERVLHTRVPERLEHELKARAADLGVSVSNLVRNVLTHAFGLVGDIVADGAAVARSAKGVGRAASEPIGWQPLVLNKNAVCAACNAILPRGADAAAAITEANGPRPIVCTTCLEELRHGRDPFA